MSDAVGPGRYRASGDHDISEFLDIIDAAVREAAGETGVPPELLPKEHQTSEYALRSRPTLFECEHQRFITRCDKGCHDVPMPLPPKLEYLEVTITEHDDLPGTC